MCGGIRLYEPRLILSRDERIVGMDDPVNAELRALRDRAYGPNADIEQDSAALARLRELEHTGRWGSAGPGAMQDIEGSTPHVQGIRPAKVAPQVVSEPAPTNPGAPFERDQERWSLRLRRWMWIGSVVLAVVLGALLTVLGDGWLSRSGDAQQVGTLREVDDLVWPETLGTATSDARGYTEFHGLTVITSDQQWAGIGTDTCMLVMKSADVTLTTPTGGSLHWGCGTTDFPATVQFEVTTSMPAELIEQFPVGTALQFVLRVPRTDALTELSVDVLAHTP